MGRDAGRSRGLHISYRTPVHTERYANVRFCISTILIKKATTCTVGW